MHTKNMYMYISICIYKNTTETNVLYTYKTFLIIQIKFRFTNPNQHHPDFWLGFVCSRYT